MITRLHLQHQVNTSVFRDNGMHLLDEIVTHLDGPRCDRMLLLLLLLLLLLMSRALLLLAMLLMLRALLSRVGASKLPAVATASAELASLVDPAERLEPAWMLALRGERK